ncbi:MAG: succinate dehydrogenase/fumarate reductase iron-sulfur subunit [Candidatus Neomarinimicrobiota bacterium]
MPKTINLEVFRYRPEQGSEPGYQSYEVPYREDWVILDALNYVKDNLDGSLSYRWSCRMGVCGSCGMMVNGKPTLTCATFMDPPSTGRPKSVRVAPLDHFPVIRDLVIAMGDFMEKLKAAKPWIIREDEQPVSQGEYRQTPAQLAAYKQFSMCINCLLCYSACPVYGLEPSFIGPAAIALGQRYNFDNRDEGAAQRNEVLARDEGIWQCTLVGECSVVCPKDVDPAAAIQRYKVATTMDWFKSVLWPWGANKA